MSYYAQLNPGHNVGHTPNDHVDVDNSTYIYWTHPGAGTVHIQADRVLKY